MKYAMKGSKQGKEGEIDVGKDGQRCVNQRNLCKRKEIRKENEKLVGEDCRNLYKRE